MEIIWASGGERGWSSDCWLRPCISQVWLPELGGPVDQVRAACCARWPGGLSVNGRWPVGLGLAGQVSGSLGVEFGNFLGGLEVGLELSAHLGSAWIGGVLPLGHQMLFPFPPSLPALQTMGSCPWRSSSSSLQTVSSTRKNWRISFTRLTWTTPSEPGPGRGGRGLRWRQPVPTQQLVPISGPLERQAA